MDALSKKAVADENKLTEDEAKKVASKAVEKDTDLPNYYDALTHEEVPITRSFEAFLILQSAEAKTRAISWLRTARLLTKKNANRDALLKEMLSNEKSDIDKQYDEIKLLMTQFNEFRTKFTATKFKNAEEISLILQDLQLMLGEMGVLEDKINHLRVLNAFLQVAASNDEITEDRQKQIDSWVTPLTFY